MKLNQLLPCSEDIEISGLSEDSREIRPGYLFGAAYGTQYIESAITNGAAAVLAGRDFDAALPVPLIKTDNPAKTFAEVAARFYGGQPAHVAAVTGTNGKTSIADFVRQILTMMGEKAASMGTLGLIKGNEPPLPSPNTTPNAVTVQRELKELSDEGYPYLIMETSSHGLHQYRVGGVRFEVAGFTNLTQDHLDYHKTFENYLNAKLILFRELLVKGGTAVLNADIDVFEKIRAACEETGKKVITYGVNGKELKLLNATPLPHGQRLQLEYFGKPVTLQIPLAGVFQAMNVLCALGIAAILSGRPDEVLKYAERIHGAKGRLELVAAYHGAAVYIDYAHTPDALENVIKALRPHTEKRLFVVFGCGGDRDAAKRPMMGKIANDLADVIFVTDDNPRTENADNIRSQIMAACPRGIDIGNRADAIRTAMSELQAGDVLIIAGKGHETGQYINGKIYPFSDHEEVLKTAQAAPGGKTGCLNNL